MAYCPGFVASKQTRHRLQTRPTQTACAVGVATRSEGQCVDKIEVYLRAS